MNKLIQYAVMVAVGVLVFASLLIPVVGESTATTKTYHNEGVPFALADPDDITTHTIVIDADGITSDGETIDASPYLVGAYTVVFGEHSILRYDPTNGRVVFGGTYGEGTSGQFTDVRTANSEETLTLTITGNELTATNGETVRTISDNWAYVSTNGTYSYCVNPCVTATDRIIGGGVTYSPFASATIICFDGTIEDVNGIIARASPAATLDGTRVTTSVIDGDLVKIDAIYFDATQNDSLKTATYTYFLAPTAIVYDNPDYVGGTMAQIIGVIPLIVIIGLIAGIMGVIAVRRGN